MAVSPLALASATLSDRQTKPTGRVFSRSFVWVASPREVVSDGHWSCRRPVEFVASPLSSPWLQSGVAEANPPAQTLPHRTLRPPYRGSPLKAERYSAPRASDPLRALSGQIALRHNRSPPRHSDTHVIDLCQRGGRLQGIELTSLLDLAL
jgi:hypothetical protein